MEDVEGVRELEWEEEEEGGGILVRCQQISRVTNIPYVANELCAKELTNDTSRL